MKSSDEQPRHLSPCPFCGGVAILGMFNVWCSKCVAATAKDADANADEIIRRWNTRSDLASCDGEKREELAKQLDHAAWKGFNQSESEFEKGYKHAMAIAAKLVRDSLSNG